MQLFGTTTSPYVRKVRIVLIEKAIDCEFVEGSPSDPRSQVASHNPLGKVPVLITDDGEPLFDSVVIVDYLDGLAGKPLCPPSGPERWTVMRWHALAQGMMDATVARLLETRRPPEKQISEAITKQEIKVQASLRFAVAQLPRRGQFLVGDQFSVADIAFGVALGYLDLRLSPAWRESYAGLARWYEVVAARPSFVATAPVQ